MLKLSSFIFCVSGVIDSFRQLLNLVFRQSMNGLHGFETAERCYRLKFYNHVIGLREGLAHKVRVTIVPGSLLHPKKTPNLPWVIVVCSRTKPLLHTI